MGFAAFDREELVGFGVKSFPGKKSKRVLLARIEQALDVLKGRYRPTLLVLEEVFHAQAQTSRLPFLVSELRRWARRCGLRVDTFHPTVVKERFCTCKKTRRELARAMVGRYWFLYRFLKTGKPQPYVIVPKPQPYWWQMFDAVALGAFVQDVPRLKPVKAKHSRPQDSPVFTHKLPNTS